MRSPKTDDEEEGETGKLNKKRTQSNVPHKHLQTLLQYMYYIVAIKCKYTFGFRALCTFSIKTKRGHQFFSISVTGVQRLCLGLMLK